MVALIEVANRLVWKNPDLNLLREREDGAEYPVLPRILQRELQIRDTRGKLFLPDLRAFGNDSVAVFSDYGGERSGDYYTYSALVCAYSLTAPFSEKMRVVRKKHNLSEKEIEFKDFGMGKLRSALPDYLEALNNLPGFLCTVAVDKRLITLFGPQQKSTKDMLSRALETEGLGRWKADVVEKLLRVLHLTAFLTALLAHDGQKILWMTDNDAICPNSELHNRLLSIFDRILSIYTRPNCKFPLIGGAVPFKPRSVELMDLLSIADVVAGSVEPCIPKHGRVPDGNTQVKVGADKVLRWLAYDGIGLKKATFMIRLGTAGAIEPGTVEFEPVRPRENVPPIPLVV